MKNKTSFKVVYLEENQGHGNAKRACLAACSHELIALMDADDISLPNRFYLQLKQFADDGSLDVVGGQITEFVGDPSNIVGRRVVPETHDEIKKYLKKRCPMNHVSVMYRKSAVERAGGYIDWYCEEDYYLWIRMFESGAKFKNVPQTIVNVRAGQEMIARRGGWKYFKSERQLQRLLLKKKIISLFRYLYNVIIRFVAEVVLPNKLRAKLFNKTRSKNFENESSSKIPFESFSHEPFSLAMCVYGGDRSDWFDVAIESIFNQSISPDEFVMLVDGPINESLQGIINKWETKFNE